jgi:hypothetical protein
MKKEKQAANAKLLQAFIHSIPGIESKKSHKDPMKIMDLVRDEALFLGTFLKRNQRFAVSSTRLVR